MLLNLNSEQWEMIKDLRDGEKAHLLKCLFCGIPENAVFTPSELSVKIAYNFITAKKTKNLGKPSDKLNITFNAEIGMFEGINQETLDIWGRAYPAVNIDQELFKMGSWLKTHPEKRKTRYDIFINKWLSKTQDKGGNNGM